MRLPFRRRNDARGQSLSPISVLLTLSSVALSPVTAISFTPAPATNLDLKDLGRVALAGDFSGISLFQFEEQNEQPFTTNGSQSLMARMPNGIFSPVVTADATILAMCTFVEGNGKEDGVIIGGNFTSLQLRTNGSGSPDIRESKAIALFNPNTSSIETLSGLEGQVYAVLCDRDTNSVYVGGNFVGKDSRNAIAWVGGQGWTDLPFRGFNGPVNSITKASNGHIIYGGSFTGLGNATAPTERDGQVINLSSATISASPSTTRDGFSDPKNIVCSTSGTDGAGKTWLLQDNSPGFWQAKFRHGFRPTKLRLYNTHLDGAGTKTWRFTALPINGIMNMTYVDPVTNKNATCTSECPLSNNQTIKFQDFHFINVIGMNEFRIDISDYYGNGGGLNGIELFGDDIFSYAINDFNEPTCANLKFKSSSTATGPWQVTPSHQSTAEYLTAQISAPITDTSAKIVFSPDIRESGFYSVNLYTPGCLQDDTCSSRGQVHLSGQMTADPTKSGPVDQTLYQTNNFDKYDQIYNGMVDASSSSFRPQITLTPVAGQDLASLTLVAQSIAFTLINSTGGLNGLFEYTPGQHVNVSDFTASAVNRLGSSFSGKSAVNTLATSGDTVFVGGNFTSPSAEHVVALNTKDSTNKTLDGGLNGEVQSMILDGNTLYVGGSFNSTSEKPVDGLNNVAAYDTEKNTWSPLGAGVNGKVMRVVGLTMNITGSTPEFVVSVNGDFDELNAFDKNPAVSVTGFGIWVPSQKNWLQNIDLQLESVDGVLSTSILDRSGSGSLYAGSLVSSTLGMRDIAGLGETLSRLPVKIQAPSKPSSSNSLAKRDSSISAGSADSLQGVVTGIFDQENKRNLTILGGHFTANGSESAINNLLIMDGKKNNEISGLGDGISQDSTVMALVVHNDILFAGGNITGTVNGNEVKALVTYNLASMSFSSQPPSLNGGDGTVSSIAVRDGTDDVYVGGSFTQAGSLDCPGVCFFSTSSSQWQQAGQNLGGTVNTLLWVDENLLLAGGNLTINNTASAYLATYDPKTLVWDAYPDAGQLPGPVEVLTAGTSDNKQIWVSGTSSNGSVYLMKSEKDDGSSWHSVGQTLQPGTKIRGLQIFQLSQSHDKHSLIDDKEVLMVTGHIVLPDFGSASGVLFDGANFRPYILTTNSGNTPGSLAVVFSEKQNFFGKDGKHLPLVFVVLIGLGISLALMLLIVVAGLILDRIRKKREGYVPAPTSMYDRGSGIQRIPPHELLEGLSKSRSGAPQM
ncbi:cortical protein marker for cell polarity-domain-containing protein [Neurospora hispaniola]|uniref:Cortical protein marker for cell polarity-domain-containing protein n=1 Tax=Neurospora hispaniola TaxID=588809 RepID=A0AAJ0IDI0_9PEZI|nr:cortical protein marker for cell polarity-domain-containing protein [Neurospora hispaniola]